MAKKIDDKLKNLKYRKSALAVATCLAFSGLPFVAHAAGLGKVTVFSALGQPLRAEVELSATREELSGMKAQLASPDAFKQAGLDYASTLIGIRFSIDKRANDQSIIKLSSDKPINDPFVDMLLELSWPAGRLVREYTFLLDPPEIAARAVAPVIPALAKPSAQNKPITEVRPSSLLEDKSPAKADVGKPRAKESVRQSPGVDTREVKRGDTLNKIANEVKPEGVSLDQMLVGLFRSNQEAFDGGNMNRLKAGRILSVPEKSVLEAIPESDAKKIVVAQSSDWNAYRRKLSGIAAQSPVKEEAAKQESTGKITPKVEDRASAAVEAKDQVKVSKAESVASKPGPLAKGVEEDQISKGKALKEANDRLASLEKNITELQKLVELKNQNLADLQKQSVAKAAPATSSASVPIAPLPAKPDPVVEKPAEKLVDKPVELKSAKPAEVAVSGPELSKSEIKPEVLPQPKPKLAPPPPPPEEPDFLNDLLEDPMTLAAGGGILALLAGLFVYKRRRSGAGDKQLPGSSTTLNPNNSLTANSVFRSTGGQSVDTSNAPAQTDFSQAGPGSIDTDEVDPVAEADVYMAYGRDAQAEEILLEAKQKDIKRYAIHLKLLEIYANRKSLSQFETLATELYGETGGVGAEWEKASAMGAKLDPPNPLYGGVTQAAMPAFDANATVIVSSQNLKNTVAMPGQLAQLAEEAAAPDSAFALPEIVPQPEAKTGIAATSELASLDFDLGMDGDADSEPTALLTETDKDISVPSPEADVSADALDFDIGGTPAIAKPVEAEVDTGVVGLDFNLTDVETESDTVVSQAPEPVVDSDLDFDITFDESPVSATAAKTTDVTSISDMLDIGEADDKEIEFDVELSKSTVLGQAAHEPSFDLSSISLDLDDAVASAQPDSVAQLAKAGVVELPDFSIEQAETVVIPQLGGESDVFDESDGDSSSEEVTTKLDLAKAYEEMGDLDGARELLEEVLKEGNAEQKEKAKSIISKIG